MYVCIKYVVVFLHLLLSSISTRVISFPAPVALVAVEVSQTHDSLHVAAPPHVARRGGVVHHRCVRLLRSVFHIIRNLETMHG